METISLLRQSIVRWALFSLALQLLIFVVSDYLPKNGNDEFGFFLLHYAVVVFWFIALLFSGRLKKGSDGLPLLLKWLLMFLVSAYALNREMSVFNQSAIWMQVLLTSSSVAMLAFALRLQLPQWLLVICMVLFTAGFWLMAYLSMYLLPMLGWGLIGIIALGIGLHTFVPALLLLYMAKLWQKTTTASPLLAKVSLATTGCMGVIVLIFCIRWQVVQQNIDRAYRSAKTTTGKAVPAWVAALQRVKPTSFHQKVLEQDLAYATSDIANRINFWSEPGSNWADVKIHDPLIMLATFFTGTSIIDSEDRMKMLQVLLNDRYASEAKLWSSDKLSTSEVITQADIWPAMRLSYTEHTLTVKNEAREFFRGSNQQEAIYVFQLPEGGVVTALSLWINGREEKALLTTKEKAATAYETIVGREKRDPSLVQWQEGNRVSVRVFPVPAAGSRKFKIGITAPLPVNNQLLTYTGPQFRGPSALHANTSVNLTSHQSTPMLWQKVSLKAAEASTYSYAGKFRQGWTVQWPASTVVAHSFQHSNTLFTLQAFKPRLLPANLQYVYADVHAGWTRSEWKKLLEMAGQRTVRVWNGAMTTVTPANEKQLYNELSGLSFSIFPFYQIPEPGNSLIVSKRGANTPSLDELSPDGPYLQATNLNDLKHQYCWFQVDGELPLYTASIRQAGLLRYATGQWSDLFYRLNNRVYEEAPIGNGGIYLYDSQIQIVPAEKPTGPWAPDHLLRLFAYHSILQKAGPTLLQNNLANENALVQLAQYAQVVSPVSSMVVLETQADYDRFGITDQKDGLQQAALQNSGAVPEPHEWALMIAALVFLFIYRSRMLKKKLCFAPKQ